MVRDLIKKEGFNRYSIVGNTIYLYLNESTYEHNEDYYVADVYIIAGNSKESIKEWFIKGFVEKYDSSDSVNQFKINGVATWLSNADRISRRTSAEVVGNNGGTYNLILDDGSVIEINCSSFLIMLDKIEQYAIQTRLKTNEHIANVKALENIDDVLAYDYKAGYPTSLEFTIKDNYVYGVDGKILLDKEDYNPEKPYSFNEYCKYNGKYYKLKFDKGFGIIPTDKNYWEEISVTRELNDLQSQINNLKD